MEYGCVQHRHFGGPGCLPEALDIRDKPIEAPNPVQQQEIDEEKPLKSDRAHRHAYIPESEICNPATAQAMISNGHPLDEYGYEEDSTE